MMEKKYKKMTTYNHVVAIELWHIIAHIIDLFRLCTINVMMEN